MSGSKRSGSGWFRALFTRFAVSLGLAVAAYACAPSSYPRLAEVAPPGGTRLMLASNAATSHGSVDVREPTPAGTSSTRRHLRGNVAAVNLSSDDTATAIFVPLWVEAQFAYGVFDPCELGGALSVLRIGVELRCALLRAGTKSAIGVALSTAGSHHTLFGSDVGATSLQWRSALEISGAANALTPLLNVVVSYGRTQRHFDYAYDDPNDGLGSGAWGFGSHGIFVVRDEWKLAFPVGLSIPINPPRKASVIIGVVPEWTFASSNEARACLHCQDVTVLGFEQELSAFVTLGLSVSD